MSEENLPFLREITGYVLDQDECRQLLKAFNGNLDQAMDKFFSSDITEIRNLINGSKPVWDESAWNAGRYAEDTASNGQTFNIDYPLGFDNHPHSTANSAAPTRPNSRIGRPGSAMSTHFGDAPRQSIEGQETGITGGSPVVFGPATKEYYDTSQWAMVPTATAYIEDPLPSHRQREEGQPAILKPSPNFNYLPALIPILHSIPQFRNALLAPEITQKSYWVGDEWWRGSAVSRARVVDMTGEDEDDALGLDIIHETQRLMAFLDNTDRAYATVESLLQLDAWKEARPKLDDPDDDLLKFLILWSEAYQKQAPDFKLNGALRSVVQVSGSDFESFVLDSTITKRDSGRTPDVYDVLDDTLFATQEGSAHITDISNVLILRLSSARPDGNDLGCRVPATLYADRYLEENRPIIHEMFEDMRQHEYRLREIKDAKDVLKYHTPAKPSAKPVESLKLLKTSMKAFQPTGDEPNPSDAVVLAQLQKLYDSIESKLAHLDEQSQTIQKTLDSISDRFKPPIDDGTETEAPTTKYPPGQTPQDATKHTYHLCGVSTRRDVIYLLHPSPTSDSPTAKQWWRVQYDSESSNPYIIRDRVDQQVVLERAVSEAASVLLVYANDEALTEKPHSLSKPLQDFAKKDNFNFLEELQKSHQDTMAWGTSDVGDGDAVAASDYPTEPNVPTGDWNKDPPDYNHDWANIGEFSYMHGRDAAASSATLTPNTDADVLEIVDVRKKAEETVGVENGMEGIVVEAKDPKMDHNKEKNEGQDDVMRGISEGKT